MQWLFKQETPCMHHHVGNIASENSLHDAWCNVRRGRQCNENARGFLWEIQTDKCDWNTLNNASADFRKRFVMMHFHDCWRTSMFELIIPFNRSGSFWFSFPLCHAEEMNCKTRESIVTAATELTTRSVARKWIESFRLGSYPFRKNILLQERIFCLERLILT